MDLNKTVNRKVQILLPLASTVFSFDVTHKISLSSIETTQRFFVIALVTTKKQIQSLP